MTGTPRFTEEEIHLENLRVNCIIGIHPHERTTEQPLIITLRFPADFGPAAASESVADTVDYGEVGRAVRSFVVAGRFQLLETLARRLAVHLCETFALSWVRLRVRKPNAVSDSDGASVSLYCAGAEGQTDSGGVGGPHGGSGAATQAGGRASQGSRR
ncbi:MAG: dihydroneopterin aldolase [Deltaproteobacteria bacterium]|nr:dihydroneopterin aldolase [Deltaproteobacteria bacterium]